MLQMIAQLHRMRKDEKGGITVLTLILLITMLLISGMAVDFMRYETERVKLQSVTDRAVLASADLSAGNPAATINDFFTTAGYGSNIVGSPIIKDVPGARTVSVRSEVDINTFYLRLAGIDLLQAPATAEALEGIGKVEIALVLDISQSMKGSKIDTLYKAAEEFAFRVLLNAEQRKFIAAEQRFLAAQEDPTFTDAQLVVLENEKIAASAAIPGSEPTQVALTIVPYAGAVNPGTWMFEYLEAKRLSEQPNGVALLSSCPHMTRDDNLVAADSNDSFSGPTIDADMTISAMRDFGTKYLGADWENIGLPREGLEQIPHFDYYGGNSTTNYSFGGVPTTQTVDFGWCPGPTSEIRWAMSDPYEATEFVRKMEMYDGTGTDYAVKYGIAALDPASRQAFNAMREAGMIGDHLIGIPADWDDIRSRKVMVVMTDGGITGQRRPTDAYPHWGSDTIRMTNEWSRWVTNKQRARANFMTQCDLAREKDIEVFTVAYELTNTQDSRTLEYCASRDIDPVTGDVIGTQHFDASGDELIEIFKDIAGSITDLRLNK